MKERKDGKFILSSVGWLSTVLLFITLLPSMFVFIPICIGIVLRRDYPESKKEGLAIIITASLGAILGLILAVYVTVYLLPNR